MRKLKKGQIVTRTRSRDVSKSLSTEYWELSFTYNSPKRQTTHFFAQKSIAFTSRASCFRFVRTVYTVKHSAIYTQRLRYVTRFQTESFAWEHRLAILVPRNEDRKEYKRAVVTKYPPIRIVSRILRRKLWKRNNVSETFAACTVVINLFVTAVRYVTVHITLAKFDNIPQLRARIWSSLYRTYCYSASKVTVNSYSNSLNLIACNIITFTCN